MSRWLYIVTIMLTIVSQLLAAQPSVISLRGHLDTDALKEATSQLQQIRSEKPEKIIVELSSTSGELSKTLDFSRELYETRAETGARIVVYVDDNAIGPAAAIPFVADELVTSLFVSWGDVLLDVQTPLPSNVLRSRVRSLIDPANPNAATLRLMAEAMSDSELEVVDDGEWRLRTAGDATLVSIVSRKGEALVVDHNQLNTLRLTAGAVSVDTFRRNYDLTAEQQKELEKEATDSVLSDVAARAKVDEKFAKHIKWNATKPNTIGRIVIDDRTHGINQSTWIYVKAALDYYRETRPSFIILELNTPGGEVFASQKISDALKEIDTNDGIPVVAFINNWAISAGAMLTYSCRFIVVAKDASMGAAEPVLAGQDGTMKTASEKVNSALRTDFANRARFFDRDPVIAEAMVDKDITAVIRFGKVLKLENDELIRRGGQHPDKVISTKGKLLTLNSEQVIEFEVGDIQLQPQKLEAITTSEEMAARWPAKKSALFSDPFFAAIPNASIETFQLDWQLQLLAFLTIPAVASILFLGMMIGFYVEINSPGFGFPGAIAMTCAFLIALSNFATEAATVLEVLMLMAGLVLIALEVFVIPGFGVAGIVGIILLIGGMFAMMLPGLQEVDFTWDTQTLNAAGEEFLFRLTWMCGTLIVGIILIAVLARYFMPKLFMFNKLISVGEETSDDGYVASHHAHLPVVGSKGEALTTLRPAGKVVIGSNDYDAVSSGGFIEKGEPVVVTLIEGARVVVEKITDTQWQPPQA